MGDKQYSPIEKIKFSWAVLYCSINDGYSLSTLPAAMYDRHNGSITDGVSHTKFYVEVEVYPLISNSLQN